MTIVRLIRMLPPPQLVWFAIWPRRLKKMDRLLNVTKTLSPNQNVTFNDTALYFISVMLFHFMQFVISRKHVPQLLFGYSTLRAVFQVIG